MRGIEQGQILKEVIAQERSSAMPYVGREVVLIETGRIRLLPAERNLTARQREQKKNEKPAKPEIGITNGLAELDRVQEEILTGKPELPAVSARWPSNVTAIKLGPKA